MTMMNNQMQDMQKFMSDFNRFVQTFKGNPQEAFMNYVKQNNISQAQMNQLFASAKQKMNEMMQFRNAFRM